MIDYLAIVPEEPPFHAVSSYDSADGGAATPKEKTSTTTTAEPIIPQTYDSRDE